MEKKPPRKVSWRKWHTHADKANRTLPSGITNRKHHAQGPERSKSKRVVQLAGMEEQWKVLTWEMESKQVPDDDEFHYCVGESGLHHEALGSISVQINLVAISRNPICLSRKGDLARSWGGSWSPGQEVQLDLFDWSPDGEAEGINTSVFLCTFAYLTLFCHP